MRQFCPNQFDQIIYTFILAFIEFESIIDLIYIYIYINIYIQGNRVQAVLFGRDIQQHEYTLIQAKMYFITNALVKTNPTKLRLVDLNYQWIINTRTVIEDVSEDEISFHTTEYSFVPFDEFHKYIDLDDPIGKICIV